MEEMEYHIEKIIEFFKENEQNEYNFKFIPSKLDNEGTIPVLGNLFALSHALNETFKKWQDFCEDNGEYELEDELDFVTILYAGDFSIDENEEDNLYTVKIDFSKLEEEDDFSMLSSGLPMLSENNEDAYVDNLVLQIVEMRNSKIPDNSLEFEKLREEYNSISLKLNLVFLSMVAFNSIYNFDIESIITVLEPLDELNIFDQDIKPIFLRYAMGIIHFYKGNAGEGVKYLEYFVNDSELNAKKEWLAINFMFLFAYNGGEARKKIDVYLIDKKLPDSYKYLMLKVMEINMRQEDDIKYAKKYANKANKLIFRDFESALFQLDEYYSADEIELAKPLLERLEGLKPDDYELLILKTDFLIKESKFQEALEVCKTLDKIKPEYDMTYVRMAMCYKGLGNIKKAKEYFNISFEHDGDADRGVIAELQNLFEEMDMD